MTTLLHFLDVGENRSEVTTKAELLAANQGDPVVAEAIERALAAPGIVIWIDNGYAVMAETEAT